MCDVPVFPMRCPSPGGSVPYRRGPNKHGQDNASGTTALSSGRGTRRRGQCLGAVLIGLSTAQAAPPPDPAGIITVRLENDSTNPGSDRYYTGGWQLGYTSPTGAVPGFLASMGEAVWGPGQQRFAIDLSQLLFTPSFTGVANPPQNDRPYAATLMAGVSLIHDTDHTRSTLGLGLGVIGPAALGSEVQNGFHRATGQEELRGWDTQIPNQPVIQLAVQRIWRAEAGNIGGLEVDVLPSLTAGAGTYRIYGEAGAEIRIGQGLKADFGAPRIRPGLTGTDAFTVPADGFAWYVFLGGDGQAVAWDETLDGLPFATSRHVSREPVVGELRGGVAFLFGRMRLAASHVIQTREFRGQRGGLFQFSSVSLGAGF